MRLAIMMEMNFMNRIVGGICNGKYTQLSGFLVN